jgi:uncharacterized protein YbjT (DUF2867 family)
MELVTGATGYVGARLLRRFAEDGRPARALARRPELVEPLAGVEPVHGDLLSGAGLPAALQGCKTAYYLVHSMEAATAGSRGGRAEAATEDAFADRDRAAAERFAEAATAAGVERIVYLGGIEPEDGARSPHLRSRLEVERILLDALPASTALRASIVIGAGSSSFRILVRLVERLRVLPLPAWRDNRTQAIAERDVIEYLARTPATPAAAGRSLDVVGPDVLTYREMLSRIADALGVGRLPLGFGSSLTPPASAVVAAVSGQPLELVRPLMESLESDLLPRDAREAADLYGIKPLGFDRSIERALREWESLEPLGAR